LCISSEPKARKGIPLLRVPGHRQLGPVHAVHRF
jgi:hypothetical protein